MKTKTEPLPDRNQEIPYHSFSEKEFFQKLNSSPPGLSNHQAETRLHQYGLNEISEEKKIHPLKLLFEQFTSPLIWILIAALAISIFFGETIDAIVIAVIIVINAILGFVQEYKAEKAIEALRKMASPKAKVLRDGHEITIDATKLVPGDVILLETGDKIPADSRIFESHDFETQEAVLTGESLPIKKSLDLFPQKTPLADRKNMVYSGTISTKGRAQAVITHTGMQTEFGKIATMIEHAQEQLTPLQKKLRLLGKHLTIAVIAIALLIFLAGVFTGKPASLMFLTAIALAVAAIPEGLPAVVTIALAVGVRRMVKRNALVRKLPSVETLGSVNVICTDKTGTLTHNQMTVTKIWANELTYELTGSGYNKDGTFILENKLADPSSLKTLLHCGTLCNDAKLNDDGKNIEVIGDPTEAALIVSAEKAHFFNLTLNQKYPRLDEIPFSSERKMMTTIHQYVDKKASFTKGSPQIILDSCDRILINGKVNRLTLQKKKEILQQNQKFAQQALRVLALATNDKITEPEKNMIFLGLQAMIDPPREEVKKSIQTCQQAGIRVIMITGDQLPTAQAIAQQLGITGKAVTGQDLEKINLDQEIENIGIFARVNPEHKLHIVEALKKKDYTVAMTGDGVNDAPALKKADIGISMGISGTDVAKEASDMILTDDNFTSIVSAVEEGRGVYDNIKKFFAFLISGNIGEVGIIALAILMGSLFPSTALPLTALLILFVNLVTDGLPAVALSVDPFEPGAMQRKPRKISDSFYSGLSPFIFYYPILMISTALGFFAWMQYHGQSIEKAQTVVFLIIVMFELFQAFAARSVRYPSFKVGLFKNKYLIGAVLLSLVATLMIIYLPFLSQIFHTVPLSLAEFLIITLASSTGFIYLEIHKYFISRKELKNLC